jgi:sulfoxide reductase heme-binding subunit YedZ
MRRPIVTGVVAGLLLFLLADAIAARAGLVAGILPRSPGPWPWIGARAAGVTALLALAASVLFGLLMSTGLLDTRLPRRQAVEVHRWLSTVTLALIAGHALLLLGDGAVRFDLIDVVVPFASTYRPAAVGLGGIAALAALIVHGSFALRRRLGARAWRRLHQLSFAALALAIAHGAWAGSDAGAPWLRIIYLVTGSLAGALVAVRALARTASSHQTRVPSDHHSAIHSGTPPSQPSA